MGKDGLISRLDEVGDVGSEHAHGSVPLEGGLEGLLERSDGVAQLALRLLVRDPAMAPEGPEGDAGIERPPPQHAVEGRREGRAKPRQPPLP